MSTVFTNTFGASAVSPADVSYAAYSFSTPLVLYWPAFSAGQTDICARFMNLTATVDTSLNVSMPDATLTSVGQDVIIFNAGSYTFDVVDFDGGAIATIATGQTYYLMLNDNTTQAGGWQTVQFGVGTGSASASALAGAGLLATAGLLNVNLNATTISASTALTSAQRAILQVWTSGSGTVTLPSAAVVGDGFFFPFANNGTGSATIATVGGDTIDGVSTSIFTQTQSAFIISSGTAWYTVGKGVQTNFAVTILNLNVAGSADITETSAQAQNIIQQYTGILTGNINVIMPATAQIYYVFNDTTGAHTLTVKTAAGTGIAVDQGAHTLLYCDGTNIVNAFTSTFGGAISISAGSATAPNFSIIGSLTTGIYSPATNQIAITANGKEVVNFTTAASAVNYAQFTNSATGSPVILAALGSDTNIGITLAPKGSGAIDIAKAAITGGAIDGTVIGAGTPAKATFTMATATTFIGAVVGNSDTATALLNARTIGGVSFDGTANIVPQTIQSINEATDTTCFPLFISASGSQSLQPLNNTALTFNSNTGKLGATSFSGAGTGLTGTAASLTTGNVTTNANMTGPVTSVGNVTSVANNAITNSMLAQAPTLTIKGNNTGGTANELDLTVAQVNAMLGAKILSVKSQVFTGTGTYTPSSGMAYCIVEVQGGGGGGGGCTAGSTVASGGGGGGGGGYARSLLTAVQIGASKAVTIGASGTGGVAGNNAGSPGGASSLGSLVVTGGGAGGGAGGSISSAGLFGAGGAGGTATVGDIGIIGQKGGTGNLPGSAAVSTSGAGGGSFLGLGGPAIPSIGTSVAGNGGTGYGGGGGGASSNSVASPTNAGGAGAAGIVIITEFCSQ